MKQSLDFSENDDVVERAEKSGRRSWSSQDLQILRKDGRSLIGENAKLNKSILEERLPSLCEKFSIAQLRTRINYERASKGKK